MSEPEQRGIFGKPVRRRIGRLSRLPLLASLLLALPAIAGASTETGKLVIFDQDVNSLVGGNADPLTMLIHAPGIEVAGVTIVTGDGWARQGVQYALKLLEIQHRSDIPVFQGAEFPLVQSPAQIVRETHLYGGVRTDPWLGAYAEHSPSFDHVAPPDGGFAHSKVRPETAAQFIVDTVKAHPHRVVIYCGGPLTNLALAINLAPEIVPLVKEVAFMGTSPELQPRTVNVTFDPEAAARVLHAPWPKLTLITVDLAEKIHQNIGLARIVANGENRPIADLYRRDVVEPAEHGRPREWFRMPDELMAAYVIDPSIITRTARYYVDVDLSPGMQRGASVFWDVSPRAYGGGPWPDGKEPPGVEKAVPSPDARIAGVPTDFDVSRFLSLYKRLMTAP